MKKYFSFGGGVQSTAAMVLAAQGEIDFKTFLFADTGDEHPETYEYMENVHKPFMAKHGMELHVLKRVSKDGVERSIREEIMNEPNLIPLPVRLTVPRKGKYRAPPLNRNCTGHWKIRVLEKHIRKEGATMHDPVMMGLGISYDEIHRMSDSKRRYQINDFPLVDGKISRAQCRTIVKDAGLPPAPRSACFYCPFHNNDYWLRLRREKPDLFEQVVDLEEEMSKRTFERFEAHSTFKTYGKMRDLPDQQSLFEDGPDTCETAHCFV
tara:strand:+ start:178 stop:975 length:798 start_codon:yes stop_codon:yes gene_type:complete